MKSSKVTITYQDTITKEYPFEYEVGLSSYDLALISINKIMNKANFNVNDSKLITYLI